MSSGEKVYCANCSNCVVVKQKEGDADRYILRVRCNKGRWSKRSGEEKLYKYFTVARRMILNCEEYHEMGEILPYIKNLKKELPIKDEIYTAKPFWHN